ncbi:DUF1036 domain-containing protein [Aliikangiella sp. IMCC44359]|uniref:DUF1036 domain-containing protein n=1 Tax=Aliikangiella sp. IMCC44359 TaxID=3459125 RepID=UPI00403A87FA
MSIKNIYFLSVFLIFFSTPVFSQLKNDFWIAVDGSTLKYTQVKGGLLLKNDCNCKMTDIELQTYPTGSNAAVRLIGYGSYYYRIHSMKSGELIKINWNKFTNSSGKYLNLNEFSFDRISISGQKHLGKNRTSVSQHFTTDPYFTVENRGFSISVKNTCKYPIRVAIHYKNTSGSWVTKSWWEFQPNKSAKLMSKNQYLLTGDSKIYYYAETTNRTNIVWKGNKTVQYIGFKKYEMRSWDDFDGDTELELNCNNSK